MAEMLPSSIGLSPIASATTELSTLEEGKSTLHSPSQEPAGTDADASPSLIQKITGEIVGTYILIFIGCGSALVDKKYTLTIMGVAVAWGLVVMVMVYSLGHISGAHFNPAVTIGLVAARKFPWKQAPVYVAAQVLGSTLASLTLVALFSQDHRPMLTIRAEDSNDLNALILEFIISFILMFVICSVGTDHNAIKELTGVAVGATIIFNILVAGPLTRASMNPARSVGPALVARKYDGLWIYIIGPVLGTITAATLYSFLRLPEKTQRQIFKTA